MSFLARMFKRFLAIDSLKHKLMVHKTYRQMRTKSFMSRDERCAAKKRERQARKRGR